jgi:hypothetical protein
MEQKQEAATSRVLNGHVAEINLCPVQEKRVHSTYKKNMSLHISASSALHQMTNGANAAYRK